jgi:hypothetical protein
MSTKPKVKEKAVQVRTKVLPIDIYNDAITLVWPISPEKAVKWCKKRGLDLDPIEPGDDACTYRTETGGSVLMLTSWDTDIHHLSLLSHEAVHIASSILRDKGVKEVDGQEEAMAYLVGLIIRSLLKALTGLKR